MMPRSRPRKLVQEREATLRDAASAQNGPGQKKGENESLGMMDKDEDELELDRMVLGDENEFMAHLEDNRLEDDSGEVEEAESGTAIGLDGVGEDLEGVDDADLFFLDGAPSGANEDATMQRPAPEDGSSLSRDAPAWEDSDDDRLVVSLAGNTRLRKLRVTETEDMVNGREYTKRLRRQFERLNPPPQWALQSERPAKRRRRSSASSSSSILSDEMDVDERDLSTLPLAKLLQSADSLTRKPATKQTKLRPEVLDIQRTKDIPLLQPSAVTSLCFHPQHPVILSSGLASTLYLHHISPGALPSPNPLLTSVHITSTPLYTSAFLPPNGDKIFFSGRRRYFHTWDLESGTIQKITRVYGQKDDQKSMERFKLSPCGRYMGLVGSGKKGGGVINILDASTCQWIASARIEGHRGVADFAWWSDGEGITVVGKGGEVGEWSVQDRSFIAIWTDEGAVGTTVLALGGRSGRTQLGGDRWVVIGSSSGIVNIYDRRSWVESGINIPPRPEPTKRFMQLTTATSHLEISADGQLLVLASRWKRDALRLVHLPSCTVYRNWPTSETPLGRISAVAFSNGGNMLAVANEQGKIRLWEIRA